MCIICNCDTDGDEFLNAFESSRQAMRRAKEAMLKCSRSSTNKAISVRYDKTHKEMTRLIKEWNKLEQKREQGYHDTVVQSSNI